MRPDVPTHTPNGRRSHTFPPPARGCHRAEHDYPIPASPLLEVEGPRPSAQQRGKQLWREVGIPDGQSCNSGPRGLLLLLPPPADSWGVSKECSEQLLSHPLFPERLPAFAVVLKALGRAAGLTLSRRAADMPCRRSLSLRR